MDSQSVFTRFTEISVLRLLTTAAAMDGKPLHMDQAWEAYDRLYDDDRVGLHAGAAGSRDPFP